MANAIIPVTPKLKTMTVKELSKWLCQLIGTLPDVADRPFCLNLFYPFDGYFPSSFVPGEAVTSFGHLQSEKDLSDQLSRLTIAQNELKQILQMQLKAKYLFNRGDIYMEAERLYITTCIRKAVLIEALHRQTYAIERPIRPVGPVFYLTLEELRWTTKTTERSRAVACVLYYRTNVYSCSIKIHDATQSPTFIGPYIFKDVSADFRVTVKFFMINFEEGGEDEFAEFLAKTPPPIMTQVGEAIVDMDAVQQGFVGFRKTVGNLMPFGLLIKGTFESK